MGELQQDPKTVLLDVFKNYDTAGKGELSPIQVQTLHGDLRMGGISLPQVLASIKYVCAGDHVVPSELYDLLQEMDRRYFLMNDLKWEFSMMDRDSSDTISEEQARWFVQAMHGRHFSKKSWENLLRSRSVPGSGVSLAEIEVLLCDIPNRLENQQAKLDEEREKEERLRKQKLNEEAIEREKEKMRQERERERQRREEDRKRQEEENRRRLQDDDERRKREEEERRRLEEEEEARRMQELERRQKEEEERRRREDEELYKDVEKLHKEAQEEEKKAEDDLNKHRKKGGSSEEESKLKTRHKESKHKRLRYQLKVAIKARDKFQLDYTITEFKKEKVDDRDMDLIKAEKLLKELSTRDNLKRAMTKREIEELEQAINTVKKHGLEVQLGKELNEANHLLTRLRRLERIRHEILELKQSTVAEIRSYTNPPVIVHTVMTATFLVLGHKEKETKDWKTVQALVGKTGKEGLKRRCLQCKPEDVSVPAAKRARDLMNKFELDEIRDVSAGAATFYVWAIAMIEEVIDRASSEASGGAS